MCKLFDDKITYVHRRLWPALVMLAARFPKERLAKSWNEHTPTGAHQSRQIAFPEWVPTETMQWAKQLSVPEAERILSPWLELDGF